MLVILSILFLIIVSIKSLPWVGLIVALSWGFYNLVRKKINVDTDIGLLIESLFILPFALLAFYLIASKGYNDFQLSRSIDDAIYLSCWTYDCYTFIFIC